MHHQLITEILYLLSGQSKSLQDFVSSLASSTHIDPPKDGSVHVRVLLCVPPPHVTEHSSQSPHSLYFLSSLAPVKMSIFEMILESTGSKL